MAFVVVTFAGRVGISGRCGHSSRLCHGRLILIGVQRKDG
jgi:hypothetical protein